jgi:RimJ/RimL family protein N-acetyltransferase
MITLRQIEKDDLKWLKNQRNDYRLRRYFRQAYLLTASEQEEWYKSVVKHEFISFVVLYDKERIGCVSLYKIDTISRKAEFSIYIVHYMQKKGYGEEALKLLLHYGFYELNLNQIYSDVFENNPSLEWYRKFGFKINEPLRQWYYKDGKYIDSYPISIIRSEYDKLYNHEPSRIS